MPVQADTEGVFERCPASNSRELIGFIEPSQASY
jgi:hypothetical protein